MQNLIPIPLVNKELFDYPAEEQLYSFVTFRLHEEWYGIAVKDVHEVVRVPPLALLPSAPFSIVGLANVRGNLLPVIDPKRILGIPSSPSSAQNRLVVLSAEGVDVGLLTDEVAEMVSVPATQLEPPLATLNMSHLPYLESICRWKDRLMGIFRVHKLMEFKAPLPLAAKEISHEKLE